MENKYSLVFVNPIGKNSGGLYEYDFYYSEKPETVWGEFWNEQCPSICGDIPPEKDTYSLVERVVGNIDINCVQNNSCFSMQDCIDGCVALCWFIIDGKYTIVKFGEEYGDVHNILKINKLEIIDKNDR